MSKTPDGKKGMNWSSRYAYLAVTACGLNAAVDGMNEKGLSFAALWYEGSEYEKIGLHDAKKALVLQDFGNWILGNCATVNDVKEKLLLCKVWGEPIDALGKIPPLHFAIHDSFANSLVIEYEKGVCKIYDNKIAVLTNVISSAHVTKKDPMHMPFDCDPSSRFTKVSFLKQVAKKPVTEREGVLLAFHLLNTVDIPKTQRKLTCENVKNVIDHTQWVVVKDLKNRQFYFRTYDDINVQSIDFKKIASGIIQDKKEIIMKPIEQFSVDITQQFQ